MSDPIRVRAKFFFEGERKFFIKGVTYGPFSPDAQGEHFGNPEKARRDLELMAEAGVNLVRIYYVPPKWFLDLCAERGIRALISIPWAEHLEFLRDRKVRAEAERAIIDGVSRNAGHPAVFGYLVGNEIPTTMVRWLGARQVTEFVEHLINLGRAADPGALFSYASYPPTEYLLPQNADFVTFNVYLHRQEDFERYLARLQNLADDKPLILGEFGMDTIRHPEEEQAEMLRWHIESVVRGGLAGTIVYAWTDEWFRGGQEILDWAFGLVRRDRSKKPAFETVKKLFAGEGSMTSRVKLPSYPKASVVVCSYNGAKTLDRCLESLKHVDYPDYEVILVDDGSKDNTQEIAARHPWIVNIRQENKGLSYARNVGARAAKGEVIVYTDSDCMADPDWLYYLIGTLLSGDYAGVGGPNISPPAENWVQACVAAAPGGPSHVLLTDVVAEHIPGCNMAFHRWAFEQVGGFDPEYRKAGDDVDFCWRLQQSGGVIAFSPAAIVWHYRRFTLQAFRKQQEGYGEAESMLRFQHLVFFGPTGTAKWKGQIYGAPRFTWLVNKPVIYHGVFGEGLFQSIYPTPQSDVAAYLSSIEWVTLTLFIFAVSIPLPFLRIVPYIMFGGTFLVALSYMIHARLEPKHDTVRARLLVAFLALAQPLVRGWARYFTWLKFKRTPPAVIATAEKDFTPTRGSITNLRFWSENGLGRERLLQEVVQALEDEGWNYSTDTGWKTWDVQVYGSFWWGVKIRTVTEYHGGPKCLTRVHLGTRMVATTFLINLILLGGLLYRHFTVPGIDWWLWVPYLIFVVVLFGRAWRLKRRVADLVGAAAARCGFRKMRRDGSVE
ncbi:MAG: glycosyltransferase [Terrimicrobiaceae bacterium]|nr:glycosyltransferase [Terrimicrobiaceae bacterium]